MQSDPAADELVEKVARAIAETAEPRGKWRYHTTEARAALAVARPFIRAEALEEAEDVVGEVGDCAEVGAYIAAIRAME